MLQLRLYDNQFQFWIWIELWVWVYVCILNWNLVPNTSLKSTILYYLSTIFQWFGIKAVLRKCKNCFFRQLVRKQGMWRNVFDLFYRKTLLWMKKLINLKSDRMHDILYILRILISRLNIFLADIDFKWNTFLAHFDFHTKSTNQAVSTSKIFCS